MVKLLVGCEGKEEVALLVEATSYFQLFSLSIRATWAATTAATTERYDAGFISQIFF